jgi:polyisoprenoid-binding protein YceI
VTRSRIIALTLVAIAVIAVGGFIAYDQVLRGDDAAALTLPSAEPATSLPPVASDEPATTTGTTTGSSSSAGPATGTDVGGEWQVAAGSVAGYRVRERLANLPAESDAVGRTSEVTGSMTLEANGDGANLTAGTLSVNTQTIASDKQMRDNRLRNEGLQTDQYPTATFKLTQPVGVPASALSGAAADVTLVGDLTLHGVTKSVQIPAQAQMADGKIQVAGSLGFPLADFGISPPNVGGFVLSISDQGTIEFLVTFEKD